MGRQAVERDPTVVAGDWPAVIAQLTLDEKASLTAGADFWTTVAVDGSASRRSPSPTVPTAPAARRCSGSASATSVCVPCGSALGATWDRRSSSGSASCSARRRRTKACRVLLAPTVNILRSPLAGRNFECYSEDPLLSGKIAAAFVRGVQSQDVATTVKHFAGNEAEFERNTISSVIDERTLREIYLVPVRARGPRGRRLGIMTAYNRLNGEYCTEHAELLQGILRDEWGFDGFVVTDWFGAGRPSAADRRASTSRCRARVASTVRPSPTPCWPARSTSRCVDAAVAPPAPRCSTGSARSTIRPGARSSRSTGPSTARWPARRPRSRPRCC